MGEKVERLVNLTVALLEARRPRTFAELKAGLHAYDQDDPEAARRMFERDKDELRRLGVPIETRPVDHLSGELGYVVDRDRYELPDVELDAEEVAALALALRLAGEQRGWLPLAKLAARAPDPAYLHTPPARVSVEADALEALAAPLVQRQALRFGYRTAAGVESTRTVDPYALAHRRGAWYVVGRDHARDAVRAFRLDRFTGRARAVGEPGAFEPPRDLDVSAHVTGAADGAVEADVAVAPGRAWEAESRGGRRAGEHDGWPVYRFAGANPLRVLSWALGLASDAVVLAPPELRDRAVAHLRSLAGGR